MPREGNSKAAQDKAQQRANVKAFREDRLDDLVPPASIDPNNRTKVERWFQRLKRSIARSDSRTATRAAAASSNKRRPLREKSGAEYNDCEEAEGESSEFDMYDDDEDDEELVEPVARRKTQVKKISKPLKTSGPVAREAPFVNPLAGVDPKSFENMGPAELARHFLMASPEFRAYVTNNIAVSFIAILVVGSC